MVRDLRRVSAPTPVKPFGSQPPETIGVVHYGLGPIGLAVARMSAARDTLHSLAAIDKNPAFQGNSLGVLMDVPGDLWPVVSPKYKSSAGAKVAFHCTGSRLKAVLPELLECIADGLNVISSCEELAFPWDEDAQTARLIDHEAQRSGVTVLGTGINPGFAMDYLPLVLTAVSARVNHVHVERRQDAGNRRISLQRKTGAGLDPEVFRRLAADGQLGHVGLRQSAQAIAAGLGWSLSSIEESIEPVIGDRRISSALGDISRGKVIGLQHTLRGFMGDKEVVFLDLQMVMGLSPTMDKVEISGEPQLSLTVPGGLHGDTSTAAIVVNAVPVVLAARPGLAVMSDLPPPRPW